jgi:uncharacterized membrane protein (UPF0127 family)
LLLIFLLILFSGVYFTLLNFGQNNDQGQLATGQVKINGKVINVEIARTPSQHSLGLGNRDFLASDIGMLFVFPDQRIRNFWMKGMQFPLDIIWIKDDTIIGIEANVPISAEKKELLPTYSSLVDVNYVLEVNAGYCEQKKIMVGDKVIITY